MPFDTLPITRFRRRTLLGLPVVGGLALAFYPRERALPDAAQQGTGPEVPLALFSKDGNLLGVAGVRTLIRSDADWRRELTDAEFTITRRKGTEFAFANLYWNCHQAGIYRCVCCGNAVPVAGQIRLGERVAKLLVALRDRQHPHRNRFESLAEPY